MLRTVVGGGLFALAVGMPTAAQAQDVPGQNAMFLTMPAPGDS